MDADAARARLEARLAALAEEERLSEAERAPVALDQESVGRLSRMDAIQVQAMALAAQQRRRAERDRIAAGLRRIGEGEYGWCAGCGEPVAEARLENDPSAALCIACAAARGG